MIEFHIITFKMKADITRSGMEGKHLNNWAETYSCEPELYFEPETEEEIRQILLKASANQRTAKVLGCGHSPSDLAFTQDYLISLKKLNKVLKVDKEKCQVTVQGGCKIEYLNEKTLPENGLSLSVQGSVSDLTVAGAISTGTHGTGLNYNISSAYVVQLRLMTATGQVLTISKEENADLFQAAVLSLGCLGVILTITIQCEKAFRLHQTQYPNKLEDVIENLNTYTQSSDHFRFMWYPHTDSVICYHASRRQEKPNTKGSWFWDMFVGYYLLEVLLYISTFFSSFVPYLNRLYFAINSKKMEFVDRSDHVFNFNCLFKQFVMEWSIPRENMGAVLMELKEWIETTQFPAHFPAEVRFVKGDDIYLSPCYQQDSCYINILMYKPFNKVLKFGDYWQKYQDIMAKNGGRPHWAKDHKYTKKQFCKIYPKWEEFCEVRERLDPHGLFLNSNLRRVFGVADNRATQSCLSGSNSGVKIV